MKPVICLPLPLLIILGSCSGIGSPRASPADVTIELDAFSGMPNPRWRLSPEEAFKLAEHLAGAVPVDGAELSEQGLGFRGFSITNPDGDGGIAESLYLAPSGHLVDQVNGSIYAEAPAAAAHLGKIAAGHGYAAVLARR